jgi:hypothetical protein
MMPTTPTDALVPSATATPVPPTAVPLLIFESNPQPFGHTETFQVRLGDLDGDGDLDLFVTNGFDQPAEACLNDGTGALVDSGVQLESPSRHLATWPALGDLNSDGDLDVVQASRARPRCGSTRHLCSQQTSEEA